MTKPATITAEALAARSSDEDVLILQVTSPAVFAQARIPGAVHVAPTDLVRGHPPAPGELPSESALTALFRRVGLTPGRTVVTCDDEGGGWAGRLAWTLDVIGHHDWLYLDGGLHAWAAAGLGFESGPPSAPSPSDIEIAVDAGPIARIDTVREALGQADLTIWDCRSAEEFAGIRLTAARNGHIPGGDAPRLAGPDRPRARHASDRGSWRQSRSARHWPGSGRDRPLSDTSPFGIRLHGGAPARLSSDSRLSGVLVGVGKSRRYAD